MRGITGFLGTDARSPVAAEILDGMVAALPGKSTGACDVYRAANIALGVGTRGNLNGTIQAALTGILWNEPELCYQLGAASKATRVDLLLAGYERWGIDGLLQRLEGYFALCIWDERERMLHLVRDPLGREALYYIHRNGRLAFGSHLRCLMHSGLVNPHLDDMAVWGYLRYQFTPGERTLLAGVRKLPPGCRLLWHNGVHSIHRYWDLAEAARTSPRSIDRQAAHQDVRKLVAERLQRQVQPTSPVHCLTEEGEASYLPELLARLGPVHRVPLDQSVEENAFAEWVGKGGASGGDEPLADPDAIALLLCGARRAQDPCQLFAHVGAAEWFAAHSFYRPRSDGFRIDHIAQDLARGSALIASMAATHERTLRQGRLTLFTEGAVQSPLSGRPLGLRDDFVWALLNPEKRPDFQHFLSYFAKLEEDLSGSEQPLTGLQRARYLDSRLWLADNAAAQLRQLQNLHGLDVRTPYLDSQIAAFAFALPEDWLLEADTAQTFLRRAFADIVPRPPSGSERPRLEINLERRLRGELRTLVHETLLGNALRSCELFDPAMLRLLVEDPHPLTPGLARCIWCLMLLGQWHERARQEIDACNTLLRAKNQCVVPPVEPAWETASPKTLPRCDIAIPVYEGAALVRDLLISIENYTDPAITPYHLWLIDDGSDPCTFARLQELVRDRPRTTLLRNEQNLGFVATANRGLVTGDAPLAMLLNTDTLVTPGWLERIVRCAMSEDRIALVNPLSNRSDNLSLELPPGLGLETIATKVAERTPTYPDIVTIVGFCVLMKRKYLDWLGALDPIFGMGYCEESDLHMRFREVGLRAVLADDAYVYHMGNGSFGTTWQTRYDANRKIFDARWANEYWHDLKCFQRNMPIERIQNALLETAVPQKGFRERVLETIDEVAGEPEWTPAQPVADYAFSRQRFKELVRWQGQRRRRRRANGDDRQVFYPSAPYVSRLPRAKGMRITFLLYGLESSGGILSMVQLAREWLLAGHDVQFVSTIADPQNLWPERINLPCQPLIYSSEERLIRDFPASDIVIPTYWLTAYRWLPRLKEKHDFRSVYYVQDYEAWFYPDHHPDRQRVIETFAMTDARVVKSQWLADLLAAHGQDSVQIHQGIDLDIFYPRQRRHRERPRVLACARPHEPRRGFGNLLGVFERLHYQRPDLELCFYGCSDEELKHHNPRFPYTNFQRIYDLNRVARLQSECDILLDPSLYQAFGMPGIEAMACGTATVLPNIGGILEYAIDRTNTLLVSPGDAATTVQAILQLLDDRELRDYLIRNAFEQPPRFCHRDEARVHLELYKRLLGNQHSHSAPLAVAG